MKDSKKLQGKLFKAAIATSIAGGSLVATMPTVSIGNAQEISFQDVKANHQFYEAIKSLTSRGIISGYEDGTYKPGEDISRAHAAKIIALALNLDTKDVKDPGFKDLNKNNPYFPYIAALVESGIVKGYEDNTFKPNGKLTRAHIAQMLVQGFKLEQEKFSSSLPFKDIKENQWFADYIQTLYSLGITTGKTNITFEPNTYVTRGQLASFVYRAEATVKQNAAEIVNIENNEIILSNGTFILNENMLGLFNGKNLSALKGAKVSYKVTENEKIEITTLEINAQGTKEEPLVLDGEDTNFTGDISIKSDHVAIKGLNIKGKVSIPSKSPTASTNLGEIGTTSITLVDVNVDEIGVTKVNVNLEFKGKSTIGILGIHSNTSIKGSSAISIKELNIHAGAANVTLDVNIDVLNIHSTNTKITLGKDVKVNNIILPQGMQLKEVISNYESVKENIKNVGGTPNPDVPKLTPFPGGDTQPSPTTDFKLSLMHFNDTHAHLDNAAKRVTAVNEVRAAKPNALLLDAGDVFSGTLYFNEFKGQADLEIMNLLKVDAMTFGNHEFDLGDSPEGHKALVDFIKAANFPFVSANVDFSKDELFTGLFNTKISTSPEKANIYSGIVKEVNGEKVGIFGLTTAETEYISSPGEITFSDYIEDAKRMVAEFESMGVNKIIALTHIGFDDNPAVDNDVELAKAVKGIDVIVGGHSHTTLSTPVVVKEHADPTIIVQAGQYAENLGTLDLTFSKDGKVIDHKGSLVKIADKAENPEAKEILKKYSEKIEEIKNKESGAVATAALENPRNADNSVRKNETPLGNLITDGMLNKAKEYDKDVVMAFQNGGGIRAGIDAGPITIGEIITVLPFGNTLATMELTGAEIKETFEFSLKELPDKESGGFLHVAGAKVVYDSNKPVGKRVKSISYKTGEDTYTEIQDDKSYKVATNAFTAKGGDGFTVLEKAYKEGRVTDLGLSDWENFRDHLVSLGTVEPKVEGRIVDEKSDFELSLMHFNDTHAQLDNAAKRVTAVNEVRAAKPDALLLDAGDVFSGSLYFNEFKGQADLAFMNLMKVDAMTFGNHEFDLGDSKEGHKALADFIKAANFPFVSANVDFSKDDLFTGLFQTKISENPEKANIYSGIVKEVNGEKVGIFGLTTAETEYIASPGKVTFSNYIEDAKKMVAEFEKMGVNKIIAITHIGYDDNPAIDNDLELAKAVKGIDIIVGGHSHTELAKPVVVGENDEPTIIVQAYQYAEKLGTLDVKFDKDGKITGHAGKLINIADKAEDPEAKEILKKYADKIEEIKTTPSGATAIKALENPRAADNSVRKNETPLGNLITDGMLAKAKQYNSKVIMAFQNGGGIRAAIDAGPITIGEILTVLPFGNTLATMELSGAEIKAAFEHSLKELPDRESGGFLHVAGAKVKYDSTKPVGQKVVSISYAQEDTYVEIENDKMYTIATNAFTAKGGDGFSMLEKAYKAGRVTDLGLSDWENFRDHLVNLVTVDPKVEGRIVDVSKSGGGEIPGGNIPEADFSGSPTAPKVYSGNVTVSVANVAILQNVEIKGNLTITGATSALTLANLTVQGDLDLSDFDGDVSMDNVDVIGETIN